MERDDPRERRSPEEREAALMKTLPAVVSHVFARAPGYRRRDPDQGPLALPASGDSRREPLQRVTAPSDALDTSRAYLASAMFRDGLCGAA